MPAKLSLESAHIGLGLLRYIYLCKVMLKNNGWKLDYKHCSPHLKYNLLNNRSFHSMIGEHKRRESIYLPIQWNINVVLSGSGKFFFSSHLLVIWMPNFFTHLFCHWHMDSAFLKPFYLFIHIFSLDTSVSEPWNNFLHAQLSSWKYHSNRVRAGSSKPIKYPDETKPDTNNVTSQP